MLVKQTVSKTLAKRARLFHESTCRYPKSLTIENPIHQKLVKKWFQKFISWTQRIEFYEGTSETLVRKRTLPESLHVKWSEHVTFIKSGVSYLDGKNKHFCTSSWRHTSKRNKVITREHLFGPLAGKILHLLNRKAIELMSSSGGTECLEYCWQHRGTLWGKVQGRFAGGAGR